MIAIYVSQGLCDIVYLKYNDNKDTLVFLIVVDITSYFVYTELIEGGKVNGRTVKKAFLACFRRGMARFPILRADPDPSIQTNRALFVKRSMLLQVKRGGHKLHILDNIISTFERRLSQYLLRRPKSDKARVLRECTQ